MEGKTVELEMMGNNKIIRIIVVVVILAVGIGLAWQQRGQSVPVNSFEECVKAGNPIMETFPEQCMTKDKKVFVNQAWVEQTKEVTIKGKIVCLPHKNSEGPQTLECAFGMQSEDGLYYGLKNIPTEQMIELQTGSEVLMSGKLTEEKDSKYDIGWSLVVERVEKLD